MTTNNKHTDFVILKSIYFMSPVEIRTLTQTSKKLKKKIQKDHNIWIHFIEAKYGSLKKCLFQTFYFPYHLFGYHGTDVFMLKFKPNFDFETTTKELKKDIMDHKYLESDYDERGYFEKTFEETGKMLNEQNNYFYVNGRNCDYYFMETAENEGDGISFGFDRFRDSEFKTKKKDQIFHLGKRVDIFSVQQAFLNNDLLELVFEYLETKELLNIWLTCKQWFILTNQNDFLLSRIERKFGSLQNSMLDRFFINYVAQSFWPREIHYHTDQICFTKEKRDEIVNEIIEEKSDLDDKIVQKDKVDGILNIVSEKTLGGEDDHEIGFFKIVNFVTDSYSRKYVPTTFNTNS
eukprot:gene7540-11864_t